MTDTEATLASDDALAGAARAVLARAETGDGTVTWDEVSEDVPAEQWGRLLGTGLVVATDDGFVVDDPDAVRATLAARDGVEPPADALASVDGPENAASDGESGDGDAADGWSTADKVAGLCSLGLMASYQIPVAKNTIGSTAHLLFGPVEAALPFGATVALLAIATTVLTTTLRSRLTDGSQREELTERMETVRERLEAARERGDDDAVERLQSRRQELMREQLGTMKQLFRPMVWAMLVTIPVFLWLSWLTINPAAAITPAAQMLPFAGRVVWTARLVGPMQVWMVWYFVCNVVANVAGKRLVRRVKPVVSQYRGAVGPR